MPYHALFVTFFHPDLIDLNELFLGEILGSWRVHGKWVLWGPVVWIPGIPSIKGIVTCLGAPKPPGPKATNFQLRALHLWKSLQDSEHSFRCFDFKGELLELREELSSEEMPTGGRLWDAGILVLSFEKNMLFG